MCAGGALSRQFIRSRQIFISGKATAFGWRILIECGRRIIIVRAGTEKPASVLSADNGRGWIFLGGVVSAFGWRHSF